MDALRSGEAARAAGTLDARGWGPAVDRLRLLGEGGPPGEGMCRRSLQVRQGRSTGRTQHRCAALGSEAGVEVDHRIHWRRV